MTSKKKDKIYISLNDLHKLYGISPETILKKSKKKKKKKKTKKAIDNQNKYGKGITQQYGLGSGGIGGVAVSMPSIASREIDTLKGTINALNNKTSKQQLSS